MQNHIHDDVELSQESKPETDAPERGRVDPVPANDAPPQEMRTAETLLASFVLTVLGGGLLIWGGSALFVEPASDAAARDPLLPLLFGTLSLALGVVWMGAAFQKRGNAA